MNPVSAGVVESVALDICTNMETIMNLYAHMCLESPAMARGVFAACNGDYRRLVGAMFVYDCMRRSA